MPNSLLAQLDELNSDLRGSTSHLVSSLDSGSSAPIVVSRNATNMEYVSPAASMVGAWIKEVNSSITSLVQNDSLGKAAGNVELERLSGLTSRVQTLSSGLEDKALSSKTARIGYALERRLAVWKSVSNCLQSEHVEVKPQFDSELARRNIQSLISRIEKKLPGSGDEEGWHRYLKIDDLKSWSLSSNDVWQDGNELAINVLSRLRWERLNEDQRNFIDQPEFSELATYLSAWARQPLTIANCSSTSNCSKRIRSIAFVTR